VVAGVVSEELNRNAAGVTGKKGNGDQPTWLVAVGVETERKEVNDGGWGGGTDKRRGPAQREGEHNVGNMG